ncbi:MAG: DUF4230 domain-containing protein [Prevotella sp.]|nr:DUF4230 domain-containing protein [Prevotella sp.]
MNKIRLIKRAIVIAVILMVGLWIYRWITGVPLISLFHHEYKMEKTATVLRSIENTNKWVFLTVEDEEVVIKEHTFGNVAKIYPSVYELGIEVDDSLKWFVIEEVDSSKTAFLKLPAIKILNPNGIDATKVNNVYGDADDAEKIAMQKEAEIKLKRRAMSPANIEVAKANAKKLFDNLFGILGCDRVDIVWTTPPKSKHKKVILGK